MKMTKEALGALKTIASDSLWAQIEPDNLDLDLFRDRKINVKVLRGEGTTDKHILATIGLTAASGDRTLELYFSRDCYLRQDSTTIQVYGVALLDSGEWQLNSLKIVDGTTGIEPTLLVAEVSIQ